MTIANIVQKIYGLTKTNSTSYPSANLLIDMNIIQNDITAQIFEADGRWQYDDSNNTDFPIATAALVAGQQDYSLSVGHLFIDRIEVLPNGGTFWYRLFPRDVSDPMWGSDILGLDIISKAAPMLYDIVGTSIFLYPIPNYSQAASLKIYFKRASIDFTDVTSTGTPGFASLFHDLIAYKVAYDYAVINLPALANGYLSVIQRKEAALKTYYMQRDVDDGPRLSMRGMRFK